MELCRESVERRCSKRMHCVPTRHRLLSYHLLIDRCYVGKFCVILSWWLSSCRRRSWAMTTLHREPEFDCHETQYCFSRRWRTNSSIPEIVGRRQNVTTAIVRSPLSYTLRRNSCQLQRRHTDAVLYEAIRTSNENAALRCNYSQLEDDLALGRKQSALH